MFKKWLCPLSLICVLAAMPVVAFGAGSSAGNVSITATVVEFFEWPTMAIVAADFGNFTGVSQTKTATLNITANTNVAGAVAIQPSDGGDGKGGVLTGPSSKTLTTEYNLTGDVTDGDGANYLTAAAFITDPHTYAMATGVGSKSLSLKVRATTAAAAADAPAANYTCTVTLTATW